MKRAKLRNNKTFQMKPSTIIGMIFLLICFFSWYFFTVFNKKITPKLVEVATRNIDKLTYNLFNDYTMISSLDDELLTNVLTLHKNQKNEIINISYNLKNAYTIVNTLASRLKNDYQSIESGDKKIEYYDEELSDMNDGLILSIPVGVASDKIFLTNLGPRIPIKVKFIGTLLTNLKTRVQNYGINNVLIEVYVDVSISHEITTPVTFQNKEMNYEILIGAQVISGEVPSYYGGLYETKSNILNVPLE